MQWGKSILTGRIACQSLAPDCPPGALLDDLAAQVDGVLLESAALHPEYGRYTLLSCNPLEVLTLDRGTLYNQAGEVLAAGSNRAIWSALRECFAAVRLREAPGQAAYLPGWIGYVGYEVGRHIERLPGKAVRDTALPDLRLAFYDALLVYDALERRWSLTELIFDDPPPGAGLAAQVLGGLASRRRGDSLERPAAPVEESDPAARPAGASAVPNFTPREYRQAIRRCVEYIAAGDIFQVNLSQRFTLRDPPEPLAIYRCLRRRNPSWYAAYLSFHSAGHRCSVLSCSSASAARGCSPARSRGRAPASAPRTPTPPRPGTSWRVPRTTPSWP